MTAKFKDGDRILVQGQEATCRGENPRVPGDYWVEFDWGGGKWSYCPSDIKLAPSLPGNSQWPFPLGPLTRL